MREAGPERLTDPSFYQRLYRVFLKNSDPVAFVEVLTNREKTGLFGTIETVEEKFSAVVTHLVEMPREEVEQ